VGETIHWRCWSVYRHIQQSIVQKVYDILLSTHPTVSTIMTDEPMWQKCQRNNVNLTPVSIQINSCKAESTRKWKLELIARSIMRTQDRINLQEFEQHSNLQIHRTLYIICPVCLRVCLRQLDICQTSWDRALCQTDGHSGVYSGVMPASVASCLAEHCAGLALAWWSTILACKHNLPAGLSASSSSTEDTLNIWCKNCRMWQLLRQ